MRALASLAASSAFCLALLAARIVYSGHDWYAFLAWNLVLAMIPLVLALLIEEIVTRGLRPLVPPLALLWLVFLPNAPYVITDFVHLTPVPPVPLWFDILLFTAFASTSLALGFVSMYWLRSLTRGGISATAEWVVVVAVFGASSVAIYLGRFEEWNSWDLFVRPATVAGDIVSRNTFARLAGVTVGLTAFLTVAYATFEALIGLGSLRESPAPTFLERDLDRGRRRTPAPHEGDEQRQIEGGVERERNCVAPSDAQRN